MEAPVPAPPDPLNDEDLLGLDVPDILHALLAPMESPASYQQQGHGPCAPLPQILLAHSLCAPNVDDASVGNMIAPARPRTCTCTRGRDGAGAQCVRR